MNTIRSNQSLGCAGLAEGTNAGTFKTSNAVAFTINGRSYQIAATDNQAISGTPLAAGQKCAFFVEVNGSGTLSIEQSEIVKAMATAGYSPGAFEWPNPVDKAVLGALVVTAESASFTPGTTDFSAAGISVAYPNVANDYGTPIEY